MAKLIIVKKYGQTPNEILNNPKISLKAKGMFGYLQSKPNNWDFSVNKMKSQLKEGKDGISTTLQELENLGYLVRTPVKTAEGKWAGVDYLLTEKPLTEKPSAEKQLTENTYNLSKKELSKKELSKKDNTLQTVVCEEHFSSDEYITNLISTGTYPIKIIGWYFKVKGLSFPTKVAGDTELKRWLRDANILKDYPQQKIGEVYKLVSEKFPFDWKLSTIVKYINETKSDEQILIECIEEAKSALGMDGDWEARARRSYLRIKEIPFENHWANPVWTKWLKKYPYLKT